ncbi:hypothetical protein GLOIN_2v1532917 [Rhizophagus clarus]|uniref:Uncharacterized protein n=1 Tax=Rhizophagus clarus TaxID=94130 RepID=A0A8H3QWJ4_9GLOM|nr:hypothetical protein GLOIN_2v1532917 [Rhizophagus clarus]
MRISITILLSINLSIEIDQSLIPIERSASRILTSQSKKRKVQFHLGITLIRFYTHNLETNKWDIPLTNGTVPEKKNSIITNAPLPRVEYTATLLSNGIIVFIGGRELYLNILRDVDINQLALYDTKVDKWSFMTAQGVSLENPPDERIIIFGGNKGTESVKHQLVELITTINPYEWSIPKIPEINLPSTTFFHSATLVDNYMFISFGN